METPEILGLKLENGRGLAALVYPWALVRTSQYTRPTRIYPLIFPVGVGLDLPLKTSV